jgi:hypothetical protein
MKNQLILFCVFLLSFQAYSQDQPKYLDLSFVKYEIDKGNNYPGYENANFILDYFFTDGISNGDRYLFEIVIIDSNLMVAFRSPETETYNKISYEKKTYLRPGQLDSIKAMVVSAKLKQLKAGVPDPVASAHTQEVLVLKWRDQNQYITGGMFNLVLFENGLDLKEIHSEIEKERKATSSIGGDYDFIFKMMRKYFDDLEKLLKEVKKN